jgi:hypothetical protein
MRVSLGLVLLVTLAGFGCTPPCNHDAICSIHGTPPNTTVCDGSDYKGCGDGNRGQVIGCVHTNEQAVCTVDGWTFEPTTASGP